jgi:hypothetical protein
MKIELLTRILDGVAGLRREGPAWLVPDDMELAVFIGLPGETLIVPRLSRIEPAAELLTVDTHKGERLFFALDAVAGVRSSAAEKHASGRGGAGFR